MLPNIISSPNCSNGTLKPTTGQGLVDPITDHVMLYCGLYLMGLITALFSLFGVTANILNFTVFFKQRGRDCVSLCLMSLACSDFGAMLLNLIYSLCFIARILYPGSTLDPDAIQYMMAWYSNLFFDISMSTTAFVSVERCLCVIMPFHFRNVFTSRVALYSLIVIYVFNIASYLPICLTQGFQVLYDTEYNKTRIKLWLDPNRPLMEQYSNVFTHITVSTISQIIVVVSTQIMVIALRRSAKFRLARASGRPSALTDVSAPNVARSTIVHNGSLHISTIRPYSTNSPAVNSVRHASRRKTRFPHETKSGLASKSHAVSKMVSILATIFIACNFWRLALVYSRRIEPEIDPKTLRNTYTLIVGIWQIVEAVNSSVNIFVYYTYWTSYRKTFLSFFCSSSDPADVGQRTTDELSETH